MPGCSLLKAIGAGRAASQACGMQVCCGARRMSAAFLWGLLRKRSRAPRHAASSRTWLRRWPARAAGMAAAGSPAPDVLSMQGSTWLPFIDCSRASGPL